MKGDEKPAQVLRPDFRNPKVMYTIFFNAAVLYYNNNNNNIHLYSADSILICSSD